MTYLQARGSILVASSPEILCRLDTDRTVTLQQDAGRLVVQLPQYVNTVIHYEVGIGQVALPQSGETNGVDLRGSETQIADESAPTLTLLVQLNMGQLEFTS